MKAETNAEAKVKKEAQLAEIKARLAADMDRQLDLFAGLIVKAPEQAKPALIRAMENMKKGFQTVSN